jgi:hypothetical protein
LAASYAAMIVLVGSLWFADWLARHWTALANAPTIGRPLRLDEVQSLASYFAAATFAIAAVVASLVHQIQGHYAHDYRGHYRLWRVVGVILLLASIDAVVNLQGVAAAIVEACLPSPPVMAGIELVRIGLWLSTIFALVLFAREVRECGLAVGMVVGLLLVGTVPSLAHWGLLGATVQGWSPAIGKSARIAIPAMSLLVMLTYVRHVYCLARGRRNNAATSRAKPRVVAKAEVDGAESDGEVLTRWQRLRARLPWTRRADDEDPNPEVKPAAKAASTTATPAPAKLAAANAPAAPYAPSSAAGNAPSSASNTASGAAAPVAKPSARPTAPAVSEPAADSRRWARWLWPFGRGSGSAAADSADGASANKSSAAVKADASHGKVATSPTKPGAAGPATVTLAGRTANGAPNAQGQAAANTVNGPRPAGPSTAPRPGGTPPLAVRPRSAPVEEPDDDDDDSEDAPDGTSRLSKAERKRLKRLQRRDDRVA